MLRLTRFIFIISLFCFLNSYKGIAQTNVYHPFPDTNAVWRMDWYTGTTGMCKDVFYFHSAFQYTMGGDTLINSFTYKKIYRSGYTVCSPFYNTYYGGLRQDTANKKVYFLRSGFSDTLIYNFNAQVGDTVRLADCTGLYGSDVGYNFVVTSIDSVIVGSKYHKRFNDSNAPNSSMIEGVGSNCGLLEGNMPYSLEQTLYLICFSHNSDIYPSSSTSCPLLVADIQDYNTNEGYIKVFPNPFSDFLTIESAEIPGVVSIRNILGELIFQIKISDLKQVIDLRVLPPGIYCISLLSKTFRIVKH